ncbi:hypothetical protein ACIRQP_42480, partial [Streptomyces sp. NPDC102274]
MMFAEAKTALRSWGLAIRAKVPNVASTEAPKPTPATTVPRAESQTRSATTPASAVRTPSPSSAEEGASSEDAERERSAATVSAPVPANRVTTTPPT